jgi:hypothetical protein
MVSVVCANALNRCVLEFKITDPAKILDKTRELVVETFQKSAEQVKDGMDISLIKIDTKTLKLEWAGANNPLYIIPQPPQPPAPSPKEKGSPSPSERGWGIEGAGRNHQSRQRTNWLYLKSNSIYHSYN